MPAGRTGTLRVLACADDPGRLRERRETNNCAVAPAAIVIAAQADSSRSAAALIEADRAAGRISMEQSLLFRVYAVFGDERLPSKYAGDAGGAPDDLVLRDVAANWRKLSSSARRTLTPFTRPPAAKGSWFSRLSGPGRADRRARRRVRPVHLTAVLGPRLEERLRRRRQGPHLVVEEQPERPGARLHAGDRP